MFGSKFGNGLDVMAPGELLMTTDITGQAGFNDQAGQGFFPVVCINPPYGPNYDYCCVMGATSDAAPFVSGLAALLYSVRPRLSNREIRDIIEQSAEKIGGYTYAAHPSHDNGTWNSEMGYGRISLSCALKLAREFIERRD
jgi:subtilisin family serine protease